MRLLGVPGCQMFFESLDGFAGFFVATVREELNAEDNFALAAGRCFAAEKGVHGVVRILSAAEVKFDIQWFADAELVSVGRFRSAGKSVLADIT